MNLKTILQPAYNNSLIENWDEMQHFNTLFNMSALHQPWQNGYKALCRGQGIKLVNKQSAIKLGLSWYKTFAEYGNNITISELANQKYEKHFHAYRLRFL